MKFPMFPQNWDSVNPLIHSGSASVGPLEPNKSNVGW